MVLIPAGSFDMGDTFNEGYASELPVHTVSVSAFYMETNLVSVDSWDQVYQWSIHHGYTYLSTYGGRGATYPVLFLSPSAVQKWCNARSEREGLTPCYYTDSAQTTLVRIGYQEATNNSCVKWTANGYRMPTEAEWEKAARGGLSGKRFPWGDLITQTNANYYSSSAYAYDVSSTRGYHPAYYDPSLWWPGYTSPVGSFRPNSYGFYQHVRECL